MWLKTVEIDWRMTDDGMPMGKVVDITGVSLADLRG